MSVLLKDGRQERLQRAGLCGCLFIYVDLDPVSDFTDKWLRHLRSYEKPQSQVFWQLVIRQSTYVRVTETVIAGQEVYKYITENFNLKNLRFVSQTLLCFSFQYSMGLKCAIMVLQFYAVGIHRTNLKKEVFMYPDI